MMMDAWRERVVEEALSWVFTPYHHMAAVKGAGVDCVMLLVRVYGDLGLVPVIEVPKYAEQWHVHRSEELYLEGIKKYCDQVETAQPADIAMYKFGRVVSHAAIIVSEALMVHSYKPARQVEIRERCAPLLHGTFDSYWSPRVGQ